MEALLEELSQWIVPLLHTYWILAAGAVLATLLPVPVPQAFKDAVTLSACRGKLWSSKPAALGPFKDVSVPQSWFLHFYVVGTISNAAVLWAFITTCCADGSLAEAEALACLLLFQLHLVRRALETLLLMSYPQGAKMHIIAYLFGLSYYLVLPLSLVPEAWYLQRQWKAALATPTVSSSSRSAHTAASASLQRMLQALGSSHPGLHVLAASTFLAANLLQLAAHAALAALSPRRGRRVGVVPEARAYRVPTGRLFTHVSCPHYLAEVMLYLGLLLMSRGRPLVLLVTVWVAANLVMAAAATQAWYRSHFKDYPAGRKALIPFIY